MKKARILSWVLSLFLLLAACNLKSTPPATSTQANVTSNPPAEPADIIFHNGTVITIETAQPTAQALAVRGNLIQAVGSEQEVMAYQGSDTVVIDLQGRALIPGFEDGHVHYTRNRWAAGHSIPEMLGEIASVGVTSITEMHSIDEYIQAMLDAEAHGQITVRVNIFGEYNCGFLEDGHSIECPSWYLDHDPILDPTRMIRIPGVKIFVDGAGNEGRGCPYNTYKYADNIVDYYPPIWSICTYPYGDLYLTEDQLTTVLIDIQNRGYRAAFHVMGDGGIDVTLNAIERALNGRSNLEVRHQIQHNSTVRDDQLARYAQLNILAQVPGYFNPCESDELEAVWYPGDKINWYSNRYALPGLGVHTYYASDANGKKNVPITETGLNAVRSFYGLVTHRQFAADGSVCLPRPWLSKYIYNVTDALRMMTLEPAFAVSMEDYIGSLKVGKYADLVILSEDPLQMDPNNLYQMQVWMTMVNGVQVYCAPGREAWCPGVIPVVASGPAVTLTSAPPAQPSATLNAIEPEQAKWDCDDRAGSPIAVAYNQPVETWLGWAAKTSAQAQAYINALRVAVTVDGNSVTAVTQLGDITQTSDGLYVVRSNFKIGILSTGLHVIRTTLNFTSAISDGFDSYGPGTPNVSVQGTCSVNVQ